MKKTAKKSFIEMKNTLIVGLDFSVDKRKRKAFAVEFGDKKLYQAIDSKLSNLDNQSLSSRLLELTKSWKEIILAIDSPMGWPTNMSRDLENHMAGTKLSNVSNEARQDYFKRTTDRFIKSTLKKNPLSIGADKIASTAFCALEIMELISSKFQLDVGYGVESSYKVIEVYPGATIVDRLGTKEKILGYKSNKEQRRKIIRSMGKMAKLYQLVDKPHFFSEEEIIEKDDTFDSFMCLLAGIDYVEKKLCTPIDVDTKKLPDFKIAKIDEQVIQKEGWIWAVTR